MSLEGTDVSDTGAALLKRLRNLKKLDLSGTRVSNSCVLELERTLPGCDVIGGVENQDVDNRSAPEVDGAAAER